MMSVKNQGIKCVVLLGAILSCFIAFVNNFPLVYQDTGSYIHCAFENLVLYDRPIFYSLFLKQTSFGNSLWYVVFAQGLLICYLVFITLGLFFEGPKRSYVFLACITFLSVCTGFSYNVSILIPDIFTPVCILCAINLLINKHLGLVRTVFIGFVFMLSVCTQFSSIPVMILFFGTILCYMGLRKIKKKSPVINIKRFALTFGIFLSCLFVIPSVHYFYNKQFKISGSNHVFAMNHLVETGVLETYLDDVCANRSYSICAYKDNLGWDFMWARESPVQKTGGWEANRQEYKAIIKDVFSTPKYLVLVIQSGIEYSFKQFFSYDVQITPPQLESTQPYAQVHWRYKHSFGEYTSSRQNRALLNVNFVNSIQHILVLVSMVFLFVVLLTPYLSSKLSFELKALLWLVILHNIINAIACSNLSTISARFQNRLVWLFPLCAIIVILKFLELYKNNSEVKPTWS